MWGIILPEWFSPKVMEARTIHIIRMIFHMAREWQLHLSRNNFVVVASMIARPTADFARPILHCLFHLIIWSANGLCNATCCLSTRMRNQWNEYIIDANSYYSFKQSQTGTYFEISIICSIQSWSRLFTFSILKSFQTPYFNLLCHIVIM